MKYIKKFENDAVLSEQIIKDKLLDILDENLYIDGSYDISRHGKEESIKYIIKYLKEIGVDFDLLLKSQKYNL